MLSLHVCIPLSSQYQASPVYDNRGFQHEERRTPSEAPQQGLYPCRPQEIPSYVAVNPNNINTHHSAPPAAAPEPAQRNGNTWWYFVSSLYVKHCVKPICVQDNNPLTCFYFTNRNPTLLKAWLGNFDMFSYQ